MCQTYKVKLIKLNEKNCIVHTYVHIKIYNYIFVQNLTNIHRLNFFRAKMQHQSSKPIKEVPKLKPKIHSPPDIYLECLLREVAVTGHHAAGTCAGGQVVDSELRFVYV